MRLLIGGSPCTHWSIAQTKNRETGPAGIGWELFLNYRIARDKYKPDYFLYENNKSMAPAIRAQITSVAEILEHDWFIVHFGAKTKTMHQKALACWQLHTCELFVNNGWVYIAERLTNGEFYAGKTDKQIQEMLEENLCEVYCPLPEELRGVHCYGGEPVMCEGSHCGEAIEAWKEEYVE